MSSRITQALDTLRTEYTLTKPLLIGDGNLESLLDAAGVNAADQEAVAQAFVKHRGINEAFWEELETGVGMDITDLKMTVDLGIITKNHLPTLQLLKGKIDDPAQTRFKAPRDYGKLTQAEWVTLIQDGGGRIPANLANENVYAATLKEQAERLFPDVALVAEVGRNDEHGLSQVSAISDFMDTFPDFNMARNNIEKYNIDHDSLLSDQAMQEAKVIQRIHRITPNAAVGTALLNEKLHSSMQIYFKGQGRLVERLYKRGVHVEDAIRVYRLAESQYAHALSVVLRYRFDLLRDNLAVVPNFTYTAEETEEFKKDIPNLEVLFGSLDYCECGHCSSMYSPAAYLTDLLRFLEEKDAIPAGKSVQDILFARRPDIANIKLNCENTNTPLPYIDLVNEILENTIPPATSDFSYQSTLTAAELLAMPENICARAYTTLKNATYPMNIAFNLWQEETRLFLQHLGVPRYKLMEAFQDRADPSNKAPLDVDIAAEYFGISSQEQKIILPAASEANAGKQNDYWGLDTTQSTLPVSDFLEKAKITYHQLLDLLQVQFVNPKANKSVINRPIDDCDVDLQTIDNLTLPKLDKMHRFLRLWRRTGWEMWELDLLIRNAKVGNSTLNDACLVALKRFRDLQEGLSLSVEELLGFFGDINTEDRVTADASAKEILPLYHRLFLNISVSNPVDDNFKLPLIADPLVDYKTTILSALAIADEDFGQLLPKTDGQLTEGSLSVLYRYAMLAKKLRLSIRDLLLLLKITDISDPFTSLTQIRDLLKYYEAIEASGFSLLELDYVLNHAPQSPIGLRTEVIVQYVGLLRTSLSNLQDELLDSNDTPRELLEKHLSKIPEFADADTLTTALDLVEGKWQEDEPSRLAFINDHFGVFIPAGANPETTLTKENFHDGDQLTEAEEQAISDRYNYVLGHLYPYLNANLITEHIASYLNLSNQQANILLTELSLPGTSTNLRHHFQVEKLIERDKDGDYVHEITATNFPEIFQVYQLIHKQSMVLGNFQLEPEELSWFIEHHSDIETLDLEGLPITAAPAASRFVHWLNWWKLLALKQQFPEPEEVTFCDILEVASDSTTSLTTLLAKLATFTQWTESNLQQLHQGLGLRHENASLDYTKADTYRRLLNCVKQMRRTGVDGVTMLSWADRSDESKDEAIAQATRQAAKSKYEVTEWLTKVQPIQDELREKKRDALIAYHIEHSLRHEPTTVGSGGQEVTNPNYWEDATDLFNYFLIDVEMNACQLTSRVKQAISSTQLFVQRCFLNLENRFVQVPKDDPDLENNWTHWKWMKNYRIWEANRKVFFYPENWIEPELRDDKSPFFKELENEILQNEVTHDNVEQAFLNYLQKVDEVAHLEVVGVYHDFHSLKEVIHVIGRTKTIPHIYYHRTYDLDYFTWSPWERIDVDITGEHVVPVVYNRKLHLFWLVFEEKPAKVKKNPGAKANASDDGGLSIPSSESPEPAKILEIQLAWSVKKHNGWTPKVVSKQKLIHPWQRPHYSYHIRPRYKESDNTLWIDLFISTTKAFNDTRFYDQFTERREYKTKNRFQETYRPWHSSSFVFDGGIVDVKMRGLWAWYHLPVEKANGTEYQKTFTTSYQYVHENFGLEGRAIKPLTSAERSGRLVLPTGMHFEYNALTNNDTHSANSNKLNIIPSGFSSKTLLRDAKDPFEAVMPMQSLATRPFVYQDSERAFFVKSEWKEVLADYQTKLTVSRYVFYPFYHPYTALFIRELNRSGLAGLLTRNIQTQPASFFPQNTFDFDTAYRPLAPHEPDETAQKDIVDFSFGGAYAISNWETFFHAPMLIAGKLSQNQRFEEAMRWYHYVFDPTNTDNLPVPQRYWITKPFYEHTAEDYRKQRIQNLIDKIDEFSDQVMAWKNNPFMPHLIARYRPVAYQRNVVMKYIDNLIAWGDQLFRRDTLESINEASLLYMLAFELLGDRPQAVPAIPRNDKAFDELLTEGRLDIFGNNKVEVATENELGLPIRAVPSTDGAEPLPRLETAYFCIPRNDKLIGYWDTVADRLFKIRNCMNIEGIVRQLPLFAPPIEPGLLVKAAAAGVDLGSVLSDLGVPNPNYRFRVLHQTAVRFCSEVKALGEKLLTILEAKDAEGLALLRSSHELKLLQAISEVQKLRIDEAQEAVLGLEKSKEIAETKADYYGNKEFMNALETKSADLLDVSIAITETLAVSEMLAAPLHAAPSFNVGVAGVGGSPEATVVWGTENIARSIQATKSAIQHLGSALSQRSSLIGTIAGFQQREEEWDFQQELASVEIKQIERQIAGAKIAVSIAEKEVENQQLQIETAKTEDEYLRNKYTNQQLYNWMLTQVSSVYFQAYQLAYDMGKRVEKSFRYELGLQDSSYIQFGYWDSLKKGLLAGDKLMHDLYRMETAYYDQHKRELELTKHVSLAQVAPWCLLQLKMTGACTLELPEWLFDMDYPGHYMRRIKTVSVSIPCVTGPYTGIHCTLSLHNSRVRISNLVGSSYEMTDATDARFKHEYGTIQSIATSHGQNDAGLFELDFSDERFLPFEGAGVISTWGIAMPQETNQFDFSTISDVILHIQYTARDGGANLAAAAQTHVNNTLPTSGVLLLSIKHQFPTEWHRFLYPSQEGADQELKLVLAREHYPFHARTANTIQVSKVHFVLNGRHDGAYQVQIQFPGQPAAEPLLDVTKDASLGNIHHKEHPTAVLPNGEGEWRIKIRRDSDTDFRSLPVESIEDLLLVIHFERA